MDRYKFIDIDSIDMWAAAVSLYELYTVSNIEIGIWIYKDAYG